MSRLISKSGSAFVSATLVLSIAGFTSPASAGVAEVTLASSSQALTYCQSGSMPANDIAYISGGPGLVQYGPAKSCAQRVPLHGLITKAIQVVGTTVSECKLANAKKAIPFCQSGSMGEWDIDYISGKIGKTINGPGYGCNVNFSTSSIGNAVCR